MAIINSYSLVAFKNLHGTIKLGKTKDYATADGTTFKAKSLYAQHPTETVEYEGRQVPKRTFVSWAKALNSNSEAQWLRDNQDTLQIVETDEYDEVLKQNKFFICEGDETVI